VGWELCGMGKWGMYGNKKKYLMSSKKSGGPNCDRCGGKGYTRDRTTDSWKSQKSEEKKKKDGKCDRCKGDGKHRGPLEFY